MRVLCAGTEVTTIERVQLAIRFRWPNAVFIVEPGSAKALSIAESDGIDLVFLIPHGTTTSASRFCTELRTVSDIPLIVMGDAQRELGLESVKALEAGADDFIDSSAELVELVARAVALVRRVRAQGTSSSSSILQTGSLLLNPATYEVFFDGKRVNLTATEFALLHLLIRNNGTIVRHRMLERSLWGDSLDSPALVKKYVHRLRRKLHEASGSQQEFIRSIYGVGYLFVADPGVPEEMSVLRQRTAL